MTDFLSKLESAYKSAYKNFAPMKYSKVRIYHGGPSYDLTKRWFIYYEYLNPKTGKMERQSPQTLKGNRLHKTKKDRLLHFEHLKKAMEQMLKEGYNPYESTRKEALYSASSLLDFALDLKKNTVSETTWRGYKDLINGFKKYLIRKSLANRPIELIDKKVISAFLNEKLAKTSAATRNSYRTALSVIFQLLEDNDYIERNIVLSIKPLKTKPERNKSYTQEEAEKILHYIEHDLKDLTLLLLIHFVSYNFLREVETCRLQVKDLYLDNDPAILHVRAKNKPVKTKRIPDIMKPLLEKYDLSNPKAFLITHEGVAESEANETHRRGIMTNRYKKVKNHFGFSNDYTIYSFRHTFTTKVYRRLRKQYPPFQSKSILMQITGHSTMKSLEKYLRDIDAELPEDFSDMLV